MSEAIGRVPQAAPQVPPQQGENKNNLKKLSETEILWLQDTKAKVSTGEELTKAEVNQVNALYVRYTEYGADEEVKGLLDYPKDLFVGLTSAMLKNSMTNQAEAAQELQEAGDNFRASWNSLKNGELDKTVIHTIDGLGDVGGAMVDMVQSSASAMVGTISMVPTAILHNLDRAGEYITEKLSNAKNNYARTLGLVPKVIFGNDNPGGSTLGVVAHTINENLKAEAAAQ